MTITKTFRSCLAVALLLALSASTAWAGGFSIYEQGARAMGRAGAFAASPSDPSAMFYNPAGLALLDGTQLYLGTTLIAPTSSFKGSGALTGVSEQQVNNIFYPPNLYLSHRLNDRVVLGVGVHTPFGLATEWENPTTFTGRQISTYTALEGVAINPTVAMSLNEQLSLGVGLDYRLSKIHMERYVVQGAPLPQPTNIGLAVLESDMNSGIGANFGLLYTLNDQMRLGASYRHSVQVDYTGTASIEQILTGNETVDAMIAAGLDPGTADVTTSITYPSILTLGLAYQLTPQMLVEANVNYWGWSSFDRLTTVGMTDIGAAVTEELDAAQNYADSFTLRLGMEWARSETMSLRGGYVYDQTPQPHESISPMLPDAARHGVVGGLGYKMGAYTLDLAFMYLMFDDADTKGESHFMYDGVYTNSGLLFGLGLGYSFGR